MDLVSWLLVGAFVLGCAVLLKKVFESSKPAVESIVSAAVVEETTAVVEESAPVVEESVAVVEPVKKTRKPRAAKPAVKTVAKPAKKKTSKKKTSLKVV